MNKAKLLLHSICLYAAQLIAIWTLNLQPVSAQVSSEGLSSQVAGESTGLALVLERRLGDRIARDLYRDPDYLDDPIIAGYLDAIWLPLMASARSRMELPPELESAFAWKLLLGRDRTVNAFALPGGYFGIHLGLVGIVSTKDELASVLAHELTHVTQRHIARMISRQTEQAPWLVGAMILGALAASKNPGGANAVIVGGQAAAAQSQLNFSRDMEREADRIGFGVSTAAGFSPLGFVSMFEKLQQNSRNNDAGNFPYLRSHPLTTERIADMKSRIPDGAKPAAEVSLEHGMVSARARLLANASVDSLRKWYAEEAFPQPERLSKAERATALYGATLAAIKLREFRRADAYSRDLSMVVKGNGPAERQHRFLMAELAMAESNPHLALDALKYAKPPQTRAELLMWTAAKVATGLAGEAADAAQLWLTDHPSDASVWQQLAIARGAQGRAVASVRAEAEVNIAHLDYSAAVTKLKAAQGLSKANARPDDHIEASIVDVRLRQIEQLLREQAVER